MATPRGRGLRPGGVVRALGRLILLVGVGFGAGLMIGVLSEEPELLANHLRGESESVALLPQGPPGSDRADADAEAGADSGPGAEPGDPPRDAVPSPARLPAAAMAELARPREQEPGSTSARGLPAVAAPRIAARPVAAPRVGPISPAAGSPPAKRQWAIQVGAFSDESAAAELADGLGAKGYPVELVPSAGRQSRFRVRVQPVPGEAEAKAMADRLKRDERLPTWVLPMEARSGS